MSHGKGVGQVSQNEPRVEFFSLARQSNKHCRYMDKEQSPSTLEKKRNRIDGFWQ